MKRQSRITAVPHRALQKRIKRYGAVEINGQKIICSKQEFFGKRLIRLSMLKL
ncbi:MAG TPA: hypothetical protein PLO24_12620 [Bacteroidales bacterium]|nr:hypothetical protein [Bacteroidales bacterium]HOS71293.1 hypothetical protein [Bacteroidales bacterium]HQH23954.1 hypothetical protein [Bacteroidales bacterium]HQJ81284.1 hypothetical protein [Bacteroidales bacterium]